MTKVFNKDFLSFRRKQLRNNMPRAELLLWAKLKNKQLNGFKFRRQYSVDNFVIDFYCPKIKLAIEIDGKNHLLKDVMEYDIHRQIIIESYSIVVLRFSNSDVYNNIEGVIKKIKGYLV